MGGGKYSLNEEGVLLIEIISDKVWKKLIKEENAITITITKSELTDAIKASAEEERDLPLPTGE
jgi:hypothetical protein